MKVISKKVMSENKEEAKIMIERRILVCPYYSNNSGENQTSLYRESEIRILE
jgi:hypothetical protein